MKYYMSGRRPRLSGWSMPHREWLLLYYRGSVELSLIEAFLTATGTVAGKYRHPYFAYC
jgi:hypothetical protein